MVEKKSHTLLQRTKSLRLSGKSRNDARAAEQWAALYAKAAAVCARSGGGPDGAVCRAGGVCRG